MEKDTAGGPRSSRQVPELDGLRGLAVAAVVAFHLGGGLLPGGWLGVDAFFTLSGYLITSLLLAEVAASGRADLGGFWRRRIRRLQPASLVVVGFCLATARWWAPAGTGAAVRSEGVAATSALANWQALWAHHPYAAGVSPSAFEHFWSLAVEEQFYLVWPLVIVLLLFVARRCGGGSAAHRRLVFGCALAGAFGSWMLLAGMPLQRGYLATDARGGSILAGAALACVLPIGRRLQLRPLARRAVGVGAAACTAALGLLWAGAGWPPRAQLGLLLPVHAACVVGVLAAVAADARTLVARGLRRRWLVGLGRVSYGVYLWHWPIFVLMTPERVHAGEIATDAVRLGLVAAAAGLSWIVVESPIRTGRRVHRTLPALATAWILIGAMIVGSTASIAPAPAWAVAKGALVMGPAVPVASGTVGGAATRRPTAAATSGRPTSPDPTTAPGDPGGTSVALVATASPPTAPVPAPTRILVVGDSLPTSLLATGDAAHHSLQVGEGHLLAQFAAVGIAAASMTLTGCPVLDEAVMLDGTPATWCQASLRRLLPLAMEGFHPNVVLWYARADAYPVALGSGVISDPITSPLDAALLRRRYADRIAWFRSYRARVILVSPGPNGDGHNAGDLRGDSSRSMRFLDEQLTAVADADRDAVIGVARMADLLCPGWPAAPGCPDRMPSGATYREVDGIHFAGPGAVAAGQWLVQQVKALAPRS